MSDYSAGLEAKIAEIKKNLATFNELIEGGETFGVAVEIAFDLPGFEDAWVRSQIYDISDLDAPVDYRFNWSLPPRFQKRRRKTKR